MIERATNAKKGSRDRRMNVIRFERDGSDNALFLMTGYLSYELHSKQHVHHALRRIYRKPKLHLGSSRASATGSGGLLRLAAFLLPTGDDRHLSCLRTNAGQAVRFRFGKPVQLTEVILSALGGAPLASGRRQPQFQTETLPAQMSGTILNEDDLEARNE